mmetsp:Transcript_31644/g.71571  ORF Transcript_31644/g.71571 Transcript_31644/m.71571 type:complete len:106 (-) Transcript_31644:333-650(-)
MFRRSAWRMAHYTSGGSSGSFRPVASASRLLGPLGGGASWGVSLLPDPPRETGSHGDSVPRSKMAVPNGGAVAQYCAEAERRQRTEIGRLRARLAEAGTDPDRSA